MGVDPLAVSFGNTHSSAARDRIGTLEAYVRWAAPRAMLARFASGLRPRDLAPLLRQRDATQTVLRAVASGHQPPADAWSTATGAGLTAAPMRLMWTKEGGVLGEGPALASTLHLLSRATTDLLLNIDPKTIHCCDGSNCLRVFVANRAGRRWCDSRICGNRARVAAFAKAHSNR
jgi:predicted RNA-binding Zn ribbon-like protein